MATPSVTTMPIIMTTAGGITTVTAFGNITAYGGILIRKRGFVLDIVGHPNPGNVDTTLYHGDTFEQSATPLDDLGLGVYSLDLGSTAFPSDFDGIIIPNTSGLFLRFRAFAANFEDHDYTYGDELTFKFPAFNKSFPLSRRTL